MAAEKDPDHPGAHAARATALSANSLTRKSMEIINWLFFGPSMLIAIWPLAGVVIAVFLILCQLALTYRSGQAFDLKLFRKAPVFAGLLWLIFNGFEAQMSVLAGKSGGLLRIDLMVLVPILYALTAMAIHSIAHQWRNGPARQGD